MFARRSFALLAIALVGAVFVPSSASAATPVDLRVMEFNIEYGGTVVSFDSIVRAVQAANADVVGVEEGFGNVPRLADALGYPYYNVRLQVISRLPLIDAPGGNGLYLFVETAPGQVVALANVHLPAGPYSPNLVRRGAKRSTILEIERRVRVPAVEPAVTALTGLVDRGIPGLLLGDFNTPSRLDWTPETVGLREQIHYPVNWPTSRFVEDAGFVDSYRVAHPDPVENPGLTWPSGRPHPPDVWSPGPNAPADRIDFIYTAGDVQTLGSDLVGGSGGPDVTIAVDPWGTDHRAVVSELSVQGGVLPTLVAVGSRLVEAGTDQTLTFHGPGGPDQHLVVIPAGEDPADPIADEPVPGEIDGTVAIADRRLGSRNVRRPADGRFVRALADTFLDRSTGRRPARVDVAARLRRRRPDRRALVERPRQPIGLDRCVSATCRPERRLLPDLVLHAFDDPGLRNARRRLRGPVASAGRSIQRLSVGRRRVPGLGATCVPRPLSGAVCD